MSDSDVLIEQMVLDIAMQVDQLDDLRLQLFLDWLTAHNGGMKVFMETVLETGIASFRGVEMQELFRLDLKTWLESLPAQGMLWEYRSISAEIDWWRDLDPLRSKRIVSSEVEQ